MSAQAGIWSFAGSPQAPERLQVLSSRLRQLGPGEEMRLQRPRTAMVFRPLVTYREARFEAQPVSRPPGLHLTWDGRLDNRDDLLRRLGPDGEEVAGASDPELVLRCYEVWGLGCLEHLIGDFALALVDEGRHRVLLARDPFGLRPLFYKETPEEIAWASALGALLGLERARPEIDREFLADYLVHPTLSEHTPYVGLRAVQPGYCVVAESGRMRSHRFWELDFSQPVSLSTDEEYEERFRELFFEAVRCRLRVDGPVYAELSGGLDSSSIVCVADRILRDETPQATALDTVSYIYDESATSNETPFVEAVEEARGRRGLHLSEREVGLLKPVPEDVFLEFPHPCFLFATRTHNLLKAMDERGGKVLLRGNGGDQVLWGEYQVPFELADHLSRLRLGELWRRLRIWSREDRTSGLRLLWLGGIEPLLPRSYRARSDTLNPLAPWLAHDFVEELNLEDRRLGPSGRIPGALPSQERQATLLQKVVIGSAWGFPALDGVIEIGLPFLDRRLVDFCLNLPFEQKLRPGETRSIHRRALGELLPAKIAQRDFKQGPGEAVYRAVAREWPWFEEMLEAPRVCEHGIADREELSKTLVRAKHGVSCQTFTLVKLLSIEQWLRSLEVRYAAASKVAM